MSDKQVVLVAGAQGVTGHAVATYIASLPNTKVYGLSRRLFQGEQNVTAMQVDLLSPDATEKALAPLHDVTHVVFAAYIEQENPADRSSVNLALLRNLLLAVQKHSPDLRHVTLYQGGKAYGADLGPFKTPAREDDPRLMSPNFYYDQEDFLKSEQQGKSWHYTVLRPEAVCGFGVGNPMNLAMLIGVYAAISRELGLPLRFPGPEAAYRALYQVTSADILAKATHWAGQTQSAQEQIFNITNGDYFRWQFMWPRIAKSFGMEVAEPVPMKLSVYMADKRALWDRLTEKYDLQRVAYERIVSWSFGDFIFGSTFDNVTSTIKARRHGFHDCIDTEDMFTAFFDDMRRRRILPPL